MSEITVLKSIWMTFYFRRDSEVRIQLTL